MENLIARTPDQITTGFERLMGSECVGCDTETSGLKPGAAELYSVQFSDGKLNVLVPVSEGIRLGALSRLLSDSAITKIFHNARFDLAFLMAAGWETNNIYDTMIAEKVLTKGADQSASLAETLYRYFAVDLEKSTRKKFGRNWDKVWTPELVEYALNDVTYLPKLMERQVEWMARLDLRNRYETQLKAMTEKLYSPADRNSR